MANSNKMVIKENGLSFSVKSNLKRIKKGIYWKLFKFSRHILDINGQISQTLPCCVSTSLRCKKTAVLDSLSWTEVQ